MSEEDPTKTRPDNGTPHHSSKRTLQLNLTETILPHLEDAVSQLEIQEDDYPAFSIALGLPLEIISIIISKTNDRKTLLNWCLVSSFCNKTASVQLYKSIVVPLKSIPLLASPSELNVALGGRTKKYDEIRLKRHGFTTTEMRRGDEDSIAWLKGKYDEMCTSTRAYARLLAILVATQEYAPHLRKNNFIESLEINNQSRCRIGCQDSECMCHTIGGLQMIQVTHRSKMQMLKKILARLPRLRTLTFREVNFTAAFWSRLQGLSHLTKLSVSSKDAWGIPLWHNMHNIPLPRSLKSFTIAGDGPINIEIALAESIKKLHYLEELNIISYYSWIKSPNNLPSAIATFVPESVKKLNVAQILNEM